MDVVEPNGFHNVNAPVLPLYFAGTFPATLVR